MKTKMEKIVLSYPPLQERLRKINGEETKALEKLNEIKADFSVTWVKYFQKVLDSVMGKLYDGIVFDLGPVDDFKKLIKESNVVLVPNHQSHADYVALNYHVYKKYKFPVYIAGGVNLNVFPIGKLFRKSGCFFIRRTFASDITYKLTLEAYLFYLLHEGHPIEFFFEGGRTRTGKLLAPRYGLFQMILEAHSRLPESKKKELKFVPVSIAHEYVPEQKSLARELKGGEKKKESFGQVVKAMKVFSYQLGSVHMRLGKPLVAEILSDQRATTHNLAFKCFLEVGANVIVTPSSLISLIMLDEPQGAVKWKDILSKAEHIIEFCKKFDVPLAKALSDDSKLRDALERAIDIFIANKKIDVIGKNSIGHVFYSIKPTARLEMLFFKNTVLHHFLIPWVMNSAWINLFTGEVEDATELRRQFLRHRDQMKYEFYLPDYGDFIKRAIDIISYSIGRDILSFEECMSLSRKELYDIATKIGPFSKSFNYIYEGYYIAALTIRSLVGDDGLEQFSHDQFIKKSKEVFELEKAHGKVILFPESYSIPLLKNSLKFISGMDLVTNQDGKYHCIDLQSLEKLIKRFGKDLMEQRSFNLGV